MDISEDRKADAVILALSGKLDATNAKTFEDKILSLINSGVQRLVVDLSQLEYVSSSGLRVFLVAAKRLQPTDGKFALCGMQDHIRQLFDLAGLSSILSIYGSRAEAVKGWGLLRHAQPSSATPATSDPLRSHDRRYGVGTTPRRLPSP